MTKYQVIIGRSENIDIVGTALGVPAKIDTGAYRSSIHAVDIKVKNDAAGKPVLHFSLLGHPCSPVKRPMQTEDFDTVLVRSSIGEVQERYEVKLKIKLGNKVFTTSFSLADRSANFFPMLIGRKTMKGRYLIDVAKSSVDRQRLIDDFSITNAPDEEDIGE